MRQLLNTLYVTTADSHLRKDGMDIVIMKGREKLGSIPIHNIQQVVCFNQVGATPGVMGLCCDNNVSLTFMTPTGRFVATVSGGMKGNVLLRRSQFHIADDPIVSIGISKNMIQGKLINCRTLLRKGLSNHPDCTEQVAESIETLTESLNSAAEVNDAGELRSIEGNAARSYFRAIDSLILKDHEHFFMKERSRRPPKDRFNALLSFLYSMLTNDVSSSLQSVGLDPYVGFLHTDRPGRQSLALDLMEEFRPLADRVALRVVNLGMVSFDGFIHDEGGGFMMDDDTRRTVIAEWQGMKNRTVYHPIIKEEMPLGLVPFVQSNLLAKCIRGELNGYPPFVYKRRLDDGIGIIRCEHFGSRWGQTSP